MNKKYESIKKLIELWEVFEEENNESDLLQFSDWLTNRLKQKPELNGKILNKRLMNEIPENLNILKYLDEPGRFLECTSRISKLHEFYIKKFFSELPINNRLEYLFLYTVNKKKTAKKTELINAHLVDYTTGMDTIKRLVNNKLLEETADESDKRARLLILTSQGSEVLAMATKKIADEIHMFLACISTNKWKKTLNVFEEINDFHSDIYLAHNDKSPAELINLMDSLKHIHK
jgi:DNA-binding MarR family transcriptional regulator